MIASSRNPQEDYKSKVARHVWILDESGPREAPGVPAEEVRFNGDFRIDPYLEVVTMPDGRDVMFWDGKGYEWDGDRFVRTFAPRLEAGSSLEPKIVSLGPDRIFGVSRSNWYGHRLLEIRRGDDEPVHHLPKLDNIMGLTRGPSGALLIHQGHNPAGDVGKVYWPDEDRYVRLEPSLFGDEDTDDIHALHWAESAGRLVAIEPNRLVAVPIDQVLALPRYRASTGRTLRG